MKKAFFIVGFNNWGKSTLIRDLFGHTSSQKFSYKKGYTISGFSNTFSVGQASNDDITYDKYLDFIRDKMNISDRDIFLALCPTMEENNDSAEILKSDELQNYRKYLFLIEYKYDLHTKLIIDKLKNIIEKFLI